MHAQYSSGRLPSTDTAITGYHQDIILVLPLREPLYRSKFPVKLRPAKLRLMYISWRTAIPEIFPEPRGVTRTQFAWGLIKLASVVICHLINLYVI